MIADIPVYYREENIQVLPRMGNLAATCTPDDEESLNVGAVDAAGLINVSAGS